MSENQPVPAARGAYDAVILDMDGVVTQTASVHASAWKDLFDEVLPQLSTAPVKPFDADADYRRYVDGRPREDGIRVFLASRGITLPEGVAAHRVDEPIVQPGLLPTIASLAERKQALFDERLAANGTVPFADAVALLHRLRRQGVPTAVVTSSRNCVAVLTAAGLTGFFDVRVDGTDALRLSLPGKPDPAMFLEAARQLQVAPGRAVVVEDAEAGVQAAAAGGFGLVVGMDRAGVGEHLRAAGADRIVSDLGELDPSLLRAFPGWAGSESGSEPWLLCYDGFDPVTEGRREALCTLGNGYWGTRGAASEVEADSVHYPGTYLAGVYNRVRTDLGEHSIVDEHMVNAPNWLPLNFRVADNAWFRPSSDQVVTYRQELDLRRAVLSRVIRFRDAAGRTTRVTSHRFVSQSAPHLAVIETVFEAEDWSGPLTVRSALDGRVANRNVAADRMLTGENLLPRTADALNDETVLLEMATTQSGIHLAMAARTRAFSDGQQLAVDRRLLTDDRGWVAHEFELALEPGRPLRVEKIVVVSTSRDRAIASPVVAVSTWIQRLPDTVDLQRAHERRWEILWEEFAVQIHAGERQRLALNLNTFHVLQSVAEADSDLDAGIPARGLHGEGYRGHIFWDEMFVYPLLTLCRPDLSRTLLGYRYRRLNEARALARAAGFDGAMFPWQSGIDGSDVTPAELFNTRSGEWMPDHSHRQRHVGLAVAYSVWQYYEATGDVDYLIRQGAELLIEVARFFVSLAGYDAAADRYDIDGTMGPDEFHDGYPGKPGLGIRNNAYTNVLTAWVLGRAVHTVSLLEEHHCRPLWDRIALRPDEVALWQHMSSRLRVPFHADGVISQFDGYEDLPEFAWEAYRSRYGDLGRLDLILNAEGDRTNNYRVSKQADVLMLLYLFSAEELRELLHEMGYPLAPEVIVKTVEFYAARSTQGSTLSNVAHSWVEARRDRERSWTFLTTALETDLSDIQGGTTHEGIHLGAMAGSVDIVRRCYTGLEIRDDKLWLHPLLPAELAYIDFTINYREQPIRLEVTATNLRLHVRAGGTAAVTVMVDGVETTLAPGEVRDFTLAPPRAPAE